MKRIEITIYALLVILANISLAFGDLCSPLIFIPEKIFAGQYWRIATHPFVHVSFYHLLLDGLAFFSLYAMLKEPKAFRRFLYVVYCTLGSMSAAAIVMPSLSSTGYCGLSGVAHGLMGICAMEMIREKDDKIYRSIGLFCLLALTAKCLYEAVTATVVFQSLHIASIGSPVAIAHLGGLTGAFVIYTILLALDNIKARSSVAIENEIQKFKPDLHSNNHSNHVLVTQ